MSFTDLAILGVLIVLLVCSGALNGHDAGFKAGARAEQQKAIAAGVGRWTVDQETGERRFVYGK